MKENAGAEGIVEVDVVGVGWGALEGAEDVEEVEGKEKPGVVLDVGRVAVAVFGSVVATGAGVNANGDAALVAAGAAVPSICASTGEGDAGVRVIVGTVKVFAPVAEVGRGSMDFETSTCAFFCSCILARILAIASASRSCFSHFEKPRKPGRVGLSARPAKWEDTVELDEATRRPRLGCDWDC